MPDIPTDKKGAFVRKESAFRRFITADGSSGFKAEKGRYHLYAALGCPWAHRTLIVRALKGLQDVISLTIVGYRWGPQGWKFDPTIPECGPDPLNGAESLRQIYELAEPGYNGRVSVPMLWDKQQKTVVNNESSEIIRMLNSEFNEFCATPEQRALDLYPADLKEKIDSVNEWILQDINIGVYKCGFAKVQAAYDEAVMALFAALDKAEGILSKSRYLCGDRFTEADVRFFTTLVRFDTAYCGIFKCNKKRVVDYPSLWPYVREIYQMKDVTPTVNMEHINKTYHLSGLSHNQSDNEKVAIVAIGPDLDFTAPHGREILTKA